MGAPPSADYFDQPPATPGLDALAPPGSPAFVPSVIDRIRHTHPTLPIDPVILHSVLLCVLAAAGPGNARLSSSLLVLRTAPDDIPVVQNLTSLLLTHAFGYPTHRHRVASGSARTPAAFISSLFFAARGSRDRERHSTHKPRRPSTVRSRTFPAAPPPGTPRSAPPPALPLPVPAGRDSGFDTDAESVPSPTAPFATRPVPVRPHSDPLAMGVGADADAVSALSLFRAPELPHALVVSGLEHASIPCQRALLEILQERLISSDLVDASLASHAPIGGWRLPDDFFCVYVCPFDAYERPKIHRSLLDKFALSATVTISPSTRQAYTSYLATHPQPLSTPQLPSPPPPLSPLSPQPDHSHSQPSFPSHFLPRLRSLTTTHTHADPRLALFTSRIFSAARLHPDLDASLLTARAVKDAEALARAHRVLGGAELGGDLIEQAAAGMDEGGESMVEDDEDDDGRQVRVRLWDDDASAFSNDPKDGGGTMGTGTGASASDSVVLEPAWLTGEDQGFVLDLSEADIGKIAPRVLSHRLRVRDGPADEVLSSLVFPACERSASSAAADNVVVYRQTVKDILVQLFKGL